MDSLRSDRVAESVSQQLLGSSTDYEIKLRYAILLSLILHIIGYWIIPHIQHTPLPEPTRFEIEIASQAGQQVVAKSTNQEQQKVVEEKVPVVEKKVVTPPKKVVTKKSTPVLTTQSQDSSDQVLVETSEEPSPPLTESSAAASKTLETNTATETSASNTVASSNKAEASNSASNKTTNEVSEAEVWGGYGQKLYEMVGKNKRYPPIAVRRHWEGEVSVVARFVAGVLVEIKLLRSSDKSVLDDESMRMVKEAIEKTPITGNLVGKNFSVTIPVSFELY